MYIAKQTLIAMDRAVRHDQGGTYRQLLAKVLPHIGDAYRGQEDGFRSHLGASLIGRECARDLWYSFHWARKAMFSGQMLRLFNRGHLEEGRFIALLLSMGCEVFQQDENGKQYRISDHGGHFGGSGDGVVMGVPDLQPGQPALGEFKTHNNKSFTKLAGSDYKDFYESLLNPALPPVSFSGAGVREAKFEHWVQMQIYMRKMNLPVALYIAVNKDNDHIYAELVPLVEQSADEFIQRAGKIIPIHVPPAKVKKSVAQMPCRFCDHKEICHLGAAPDVNCRTCNDVEAKPDGTWYCNSKERQLELLFPACPDFGETYTLTKERQHKACSHYTKNPNF